MISTWVGLRYYLARDYPQAIEQIEIPLSWIQISLRLTLCSGKIMFSQACLAEGLVS